MGMGERRAAKLVGLAQGKISEPVVCAAVISPKGRRGAQMAGGLIGQALHSSTNNAHGFAPVNLFALTDSGLYTFVAGENLGIRVKEQSGYFPWGSFGASSNIGAMSKFLFLGWPDGSISQLEAANNGPATVQGDVIDEIVRRAAAAGAYPPPNL
jgi:hypothetical protein